MSDDVIGLKHGARWKKMRETDSIKWRGVSATTMAILVGAGWERLLDMKRVIDQPTRGKA